MAQCEAISSYDRANQIVRLQRCQNKAMHMVEPEGVALCGTHLNSAHRHMIDVVMTLPKQGDN